MRRYTCNIEHLGGCNSRIVKGFRDVSEKVLFNNDFTDGDEAQQAVDSACWGWLVDSKLLKYCTSESPVVCEVGMW